MGRLARSEPAADHTEDVIARPFKFKLLDHVGFDFVCERPEGMSSWSNQWSINHKVQATEGSSIAACEMQAIGDLAHSALGCKETDEEDLVPDTEETCGVVPDQVDNEPSGSPGNRPEHIDDLQACITEFRADMRDLFRDYCENPAEFDFRAGLSEVIGQLHDCLDDWFANTHWKQHFGADQAHLI